MQLVQWHSLEDERRVINVNVGTVSFKVIYRRLLPDCRQMPAMWGPATLGERWFVFLYFRQKKLLYTQYLRLCIWLAISAWWQAQRLSTKWLTVALAAGLDPPWGENILALHKFLTRFQIADDSMRFSAPAAFYQQWDSPVTCSCPYTLTCPHLLLTN